MINSSSPEVARNARPYLSGDEDALLLNALHSGQYNHSTVTDHFEEAVASILGVPETVAVASGTAALHLALLAAGIGQGDEVLVPSFTFCATVQAILATGAHPRFVEIDPATGCVEPTALIEALTPHTRAVIPVHYGGRGVDLSDAQATFIERGITVVEDAAHSFGSVTQGGPVGATGALTCFSFGPIKNLTCGQGGMIVPRNAQEADTCRRLRGLGIIQSAAWRTDAVTYEIDSFGMRVQMSGLNAAIGLGQLPHFERTSARRQTLWQSYAHALDGIPGVSLINVDIDRTVPHLCAVRVLENRDRVFSEMRAKGIGVGTHYPPNHQQPAFKAWYRALPVTEQMGQQIMTLPFHPHLTEHDTAHVACELRHAVTDEAGH